MSTPVDPMPPSNILNGQDMNTTSASATDSEKLNFIFNEMHKLCDLFEEIKELKRSNKIKDEQIQNLEIRLDAS